MMFKKIKLKARESKLCSILLLILFFFVIFDLRCLDYENLVYENSIENNYWNYNNEISYELDDDLSRKLKSKIDKSFDTITLYDTMIRNAFAAFKFVKDQDGNDNDNLNIFLKLKNETTTSDNGVLALDFDINIFSIKFWYRMIIWLILSTFFIDRITIRLINIIYIHKSDGEKGNIVSTYLSAI